MRKVPSLQSAIVVGTHKMTAPQPAERGYGAAILVSCMFVIVTEDMREVA